MSLASNRVLTVAQSHTHEQDLAVPVFTKENFAILWRENNEFRREVMRLKNKLLIRQAEMINAEGIDYIPRKALMKVV